MGISNYKQDTLGIQESIKSIGLKQAELQKSLEHTQQEYYEMATTVTHLQEKNKRTEARLEMTENRVMLLEKEMATCKSKIIESASRSMKDNLLINGIEEHKGEHILSLVIQFMKEAMQIKESYFKCSAHDTADDENTIWIQRCHRIGRQGRPGAHRAIVVKMITGRDCVLKHAKNLKGTSYYISIQNPPEINEAKKQVAPIFRKAKADGKHPRYVGKGDAVYLDGKTYRSLVVPTCSTPALTIIERKTAMHINSTPITEESGNKFSAHMAIINSHGDVAPTLMAITSMHPSVATATHNMSVARV